MKDGSAGRLCLSIVSDPTLLSGLYHTIFITQTLAMVQGLCFFQDLLRT